MWIILFLGLFIGSYMISVSWICFKMMLLDKQIGKEVRQELEEKEINQIASMFSLGIVIYFIIFKTVIL